MDNNIKHIKEHLFEGYLLEDLDSVINKLDRKKIVNNGHCGYVAVQIILAGMECLANINLKKLFRNALRNGTAHYFFTKAGITITLDEQQIGHLAIGIEEISKKNSINIAISKLYNDFLESYELFKPEWKNFKKGCNSIIKDIESGQISVDKYLETFPKYQVTYRI